MKNTLIQVNENIFCIILKSKKYGDKKCFFDKSSLRVISCFDVWVLHCKEKERNFYAISKIGYSYTGFQSHISMHRLLLSFPESGLVDHINGNSLDNSLQNLRIVNNSQNMMNRGFIPKSYTKYKGVYLNPQSSKKPYLSKIKLNNKEYYLGSFGTDKEAAIAYNKAAIEMFGEYARLNEIT